MPLKRLAAATAIAGPSETKTLRHWATIAGIGLIILIIATDSYEGWQDYRRVIADNERSMVALSRALTEQTARMVQDVDVVLSSYATWAASTSGRSADRQTMIGQLQRQMAKLPFVSAAALLGIDGQLIAGTEGDASGRQSLQDPAVFASSANAADDALFIDRLGRGTNDQSQILALSRRIISSTGDFEGVVVARLSFDYLSNFYAGVSPTPDTVIRLARMDGVTLLRYPPDGQLSPRAGSGPWDPTLIQANPQVMHRISNGHERIQVFQRVVGYPVAVTVTRSLSSVLQPWIQEERSSAARTLTLAVLAAMLLLALRSALNRQAHIDRERHRLEQELAGVQRVEALGFLAASVAHDFNNVLTAIIGYAELMREMVEGEPPLLLNVDRLLAATERARLLVRRVLTFDARRSVSYVPTRIEPIVAEVSQQVQATLPATVHIKVIGGESSPAILGDATEIYQVLMNLCSNAVHAMPAGGSLEIALETLAVHEPRSLALGDLSPGDWVCLSVTDTGVGLADEQTRFIFEPFYTTRQPTHGTGIGLTVVRNIILRMNGALDVESRLAIGTRMAVYWPVIDASAVVPGELARDSGGAGETILVVDDEKELVALTEDLLASLSYEPVGFSDARTALDAFRSDPKRFDLILTDERMQPLRGLDFAKLIHRLEPSVPIILMTGHRDAKVDAHAREAGIAEILDKPLRVQMLREALGRHLRGSSEGSSPHKARGALGWLIFFTLSCAAGRRAQADDPAAESGSHASLGPGWYTEASYPGARSLRNIFIPFVDAEYAGRFYSNASDVAGVYAYKRSNAEAGAALEYDLTERLARDDPRFHNFRDIKETPRFKLFADRTVSFVTGDANIATDMAGRGQGTLAQANVWLTLPLIPKTLISAGPGMTWADSQYMRTFFSISGAQAAVSPFMAYQAHAGVLDSHWNGLEIYEISRRWSVGASQYFGRLHADADNSPVTSRRSQGAMLAWLAYKLK